MRVYASDSDETAGEQGSGRDEVEEHTMSDEQRSLARREFIKRIAMAGALPAVVAVIAAQSQLKAMPPPPPTPPPPPPPVPEIPGLTEPGTMVLMGLGVAGVLGAALRKKKDDSGSDSEK